MTDVQKEEKERLVIRLSRPEDTQEIDALRKVSYFETADWAEFKRTPDYISVANDSPEDQVLVAFLPSGKLAATVRLGIAKTQAELIDQLGAVVHVNDDQLPIMTAGRACAVPGGGYYKALRLAFLEVAHAMRFNGHPIVAQMGVNAANNPVPRSVVRLGYEVFPVDEGDFIFSGPHVANRIHRDRFMQAIFLLRAEQQAGKTPEWDWEGPLPFKQYLNWVRQ
ncbi:MAG: hypothetical protein ABI605_04890 [Rhizobacter sp.]